MQDAGNVRELFHPDNSDVKRGVVLVVLASVLGVFLSIQVIGKEPGTVTAAAELPVVDETTSSLAATTTTRATFTSELNKVEVVEGPIANSISTSSTSSTSTTVKETTTTVYVRQPSDVIVKVFNGSGAAGIASKGTKMIAAEGYETVTPGDTPSRVIDSEILYSEGFESEAADILEILKAKEDVEPELLTTRNRPVNTLNGIDVVVIVGRDGDIPL